MFCSQPAHAIEDNDLQITADVYLSYDYQYKKVMYAKNIDKNIAPASLTKLMTALLLYENYPLNHEFITSYPSNYVFSGKVAYIPEGMSVTTEELLELLLVYSANDAAYIVANTVFSNYEDFILEMNDKSNELSMFSTNFVNPDGLDEKNHITTANDMLKLSIYILENTKLLDITSKKDILFDKLDKKLFKNTNLIIESGFIGLKTGWTSAAGLTFIGYNQENNRKIITIVNKSDVDEDKLNHFVDTKILYQISKDNFAYLNILDRNSELFVIKNSTNVRLIKNNDDFYIFKKLEEEELSYLVSIKNNIFQIYYPEIDEDRKYKINSTNKIEYKFHWSNRFLNNILNR
tara:strand:- start:541 stop:1584 length:1044 start_codon:yes stop_codon:yes gene_type:complete